MSFFRHISRQRISSLLLCRKETAPTTTRKLKLIAATTLRQIRLQAVRLCRFSSIPVGTATTLAFLGFSKATPPKQVNAMTDSLDTVLQNADQLFDENHYQDVVDVLSKFSDQNSPEIMWRKSRAYYSLAKGVKDKSERAQLIRDSYALIQSALEADDSNYAIHKWMAIVLDANSELDGIKARVSQLETVKKHMNRAIELNTNDPTNWYMLGSFEFGLAELPWMQRKIVSAIFATPPTGTFEKALEYFQRAEEIKPGFFSLNWLMVGKCHLALKNLPEAKTYLEKAANRAVLNEDDKRSKEEATQLLKKL